MPELAEFQFRATNLARTLDQLKDAGFWSVGLDGGGEETIDRFDWPKKRIIVLGAEGPGLSAAALERAARRVRIPIAADVDSLNVGHAAAVAFAITGRPV